MVFSSAVMFANRRMFWNVRAMPRRATACGLRPDSLSPFSRKPPALAGRGR